MVHFLRKSSSAMADVVVANITEVKPSSQDPITPFTGNMMITAVKSSSSDDNHNNNKNGDADDDSSITLPSTLFVNNFAISKDHHPRVLLMYVAEQQRAMTDSTRQMLDRIQVELLKLDSIELLLDFNWKNPLRDNNFSFDMPNPCTAVYDNFHESYSKDFHTAGTGSNTTNPYEVEMTRQGSANYRGYSVTFSGVQVREYNRTVGDHPDVSDDGPPLAIDWDYIEHRKVPLFHYEARKKQRRQRRLDRRNQALMAKASRGSGKDLRKPKKSAVKNMEMTVPRLRGAARMALLHLEFNVPFQDIVNAQVEVKRVAHQRQESNNQGILAEKTEELLQAAQRKIRRSLLFGLGASSGSSYSSSSSSVLHKAGNTANKNKNKTTNSSTTCTSNNVDTEKTVHSNYNIPSNGQDSNKSSGYIPKKNNSTCGLVMETVSFGKRKSCKTSKITQDSTSSTGRNPKKSNCTIRGRPMTTTTAFLMIIAAVISSSSVIENRCGCDALSMKAVNVGRENGGSGMSPSSLSSADNQQQLQIAFVTGNEMKARELNMILAECTKDDTPFRSISSDGDDDNNTNNSNNAVVNSSLVNLRVINVDLPEIQEVNTEAIAKEKALLGAQLAGGPCVVEDTSLLFTALGGMPGPYIKWFQDRLGSQGLYNILTAYEDKSAQAVCTLAFCPYPHADPVLFTGVTKGVIVEPVEGRGFGWDSIFVPEGSDVPFSCMTTEEKNEKSHRGKAVRQWAQWLRRNQKELWERQGGRRAIGHKGLDFRCTSVEE